jgi:hypothetical protein
MEFVLVDLLGRRSRTTGAVDCTCWCSQAARRAGRSGIRWTAKVRKATLGSVADDPNARRSRLCPRIDRGTGSRGAAPAPPRRGRAIRIFDDIERRHGLRELGRTPTSFSVQTGAFCLERAHAGKRILLGGVPGTGKGGDPGRRRGRRERDPWSPRKGLRRFRLVAAKKNSHAWTDGWTRKDSDKSLGPP